MDYAPDGRAAGRDWAASGISLESGSNHSSEPRQLHSAEKDSAKLLPLHRRGGASLSSSIFNLANTIMGSGLLTLPSAFSEAGLFVGLVMAVVAAALNVFTLHCLARASKSRLVPAGASIGVVAEVALPGIGGLVIDVAVALYGFGVCTGYLIVSTDSLVDVTGVRQRWLWTCLSALIVTPLTLLSSLDALRFTSTLAILALLTVTLVVLVFYAASEPLGACDGYAAATVSCVPADAPPVEACPGQIEPLSRPMVPTLRALSKFVLAFGCQQNILPIVDELAHPTRRRVSRVSAVAISLALGVYLVVASSGYLTFGDRVCSNILNSYPRTVVIAGARVLIAAVVLTSYPLLAWESKRAALLRSAACVRALARRRELARRRPPVRMGRDAEEEEGVSSSSSSSTSSSTSSSAAAEGTASGTGLAAEGGGSGAAACDAPSSVGLTRTTSCGDVLRSGPQGFLTPHSRGSAAAHPEPTSALRTPSRTGLGRSTGRTPRTPGTLRRGGLSSHGCFVAAAEQRAVAGLFICGTLTVALSVSNLGVIVGLVGASAGIMISFIVPCACFVSLAIGWDASRCAALLTLILGMVLLPVCVGVELTHGGR